MKKTVCEKLKAKIVDIDRQRANLNYQLARNEYQIVVFDLAVAERRIEKANGKNVDDVYSSDLSRIIALYSRKRKLRRKQNQLDLKSSFLKFFFRVINSFK